MIEKGWNLYKQVHIVPDDDLKVHIMDKTCWCNPSTSWENKWFKVTHNSLDGRELAEDWINEINNHLK